MEGRMEFGWRDDVGGRECGRKRADIGGREDEGYSREGVWELNQKATDGGILDWMSLG